MTRRLSGLVLLLALAVLAGGLRGRAGVPPGRERDAGRRPRSGRRVLPQGGAGRPRQRQLQDRAASARCSRPRARTSTGRRQFEQQDQLEAALGEYKLASEYDPSNRQVGRQGRRARPDDPRAHRSGAAASRPIAAAARARARRVAPTPCSTRRRASRCIVRFNNASLRDILNFIANATGINITYDREVAGSRRRPCSSTASRSSRR